MASISGNIYLKIVSGTALTSIATPSSGEVHVNLWLLLHSLHDSAITFDIYHSDGTDDIKITTKTIQGGKSAVITDLVGVRINSGQILKIKGSELNGQYSVDLNVSIVTK